jgi:hypothetical protein
MTFESTYLRLGPLPEYNNAHGPIPDVQVRFKVIQGVISNRQL